MPEVRPPLIVLGMHRSGTSLVARMLERLGVFVGADLERNHESNYFMGRNERVLRRADASWDHPGPIDRLLDDPVFRAEAVAMLGRSIRFPGWARYLGPARTMRWHTASRLRQPWGWKDPRTTLTAPLWLEIFPQARVIHVVRHGVDVAASLLKRDGDLAAVGRTPSTLRSLDAGLALWEDYVGRGHDLGPMLGDRFLEVRYEALLDRPEPVLGELAQFARIGADPFRIRAAAGLARRNRALAHRSDPGLAAFAAARRDQLENYGFQ